MQISHSSLEDLGETSLRGLAKSLESLAIVSSKLKFIPQTTLSTLRRLKILDFEGNQVQELGPYSFHNILLQKVRISHPDLISALCLYLIFNHYNKSPEIRSTVKSGLYLNKKLDLDFSISAEP